MPRLDDVAVRVLRDLLVILDEHGKQAAFVGAQHHPRFLRQLEEALMRDDRQVRVRAFPDADHALEWCERLLLADRPEADGDAPERSLEAHDLCRGLDAHALEAFAAILEQRRFEAGALIVRQGDPPDGLYLLLRGNVSVTIDVPRGERRRLATVSAGMSFGDLALIGRGPRSAASPCAPAASVCHSSAPSLPPRLATNHVPVTSPPTYRSPAPSTASARAVAASAPTNTTAQQATAQLATAQQAKGQQSSLCYRLVPDSVHAGVAVIMRAVRADGDTLRLVPVESGASQRAWLVLGDGLKGVMATSGDLRSAVRVVATPTACPTP